MGILLFAFLTPRFSLLLYILRSYAGVPCVFCCLYVVIVGFGVLVVNMG